ncbi:tyrosine-protein kinase STYK1-like [Protopterus annectens]|uniref:tyrosine-protein kinase STYK1-like n=1 Tax=Protopterus annectens TaxID=7888 RepID=UPI001CFA18A9|nr:tyrosine-protein kinase STYK1-like [Protopterus annectens]
MGRVLLECNTTAGNQQCGKGTSEEIIVIPVLLAVSTVIVVAIILWKMCKMKKDKEKTPIIILSDGSIDTASPSEVGEFVQLITFHTAVRKNDYLVKMLWCQTEAQPLYLILEAMSLGNLLHFLWKVAQVDTSSADYTYSFTEKKLYNVALQIASGLDYLTGVQKLIHGYVATQSVVIHEDMRVKLCNLGIAFDVYRTGSLSSRRAATTPVKWLAPERLAKQPVTDKSDVWSFGIFLYELVTLGAPPYPDLQPVDVFPKLQRGYRMQKPQLCKNSLYDIMKHCWEWKSHDRPSFGKLIKSLESLMSHADSVTLLTSTSKLELAQYRQIAGVFD